MRWLSWILTLIANPQSLGFAFAKPLFHLCGFGQSQDAAGADVQVAALSDPVINTSGDDLTIPELEHLVAYSAGVSSGGTALARLSTPSLLKYTRLFQAQRIH